MAKKAGKKAPSKKAAKGRPLKSYTVKHNVRLMVIANGGQLSMGHIESSDSDENALLDGDEGEFGCWDSDITILRDCWWIEGADGPSGGRNSVRLIVPTDLIRFVKFDEYDLDRK